MAKKRKEIRNDVFVFLSNKYSNDGNRFIRLRLYSVGIIIGEKTSNERGTRVCGGKFRQIHATDEIIKGKLVHCIRRLNMYSYF